eukprot:Skav206687  [mRNA]  locus=scaffold1764:19776:25916:+ [translate_table: standard]
MSGGTYTHASGSKFSGEWQDSGLWSNTECEVWETFWTHFGDMLCSDRISLFKARSGRGDFTWADGSSYSGRADVFVRSCQDIHGQGKYSWEDGRVYEGQWDRNRMHGSGRFRWADGRVYEGGYVNDSKEGQGTFSWPDGRDVCYLDYGEVPACVHTRLVVGEVDRATHEFQILTPDFDSYIEILDGSNPDLVSFHRSGPAGGLPVGVNPATIYGFAAMTPQQLNRYLQQGRIDADQERALRGLAPLPVPGAAVADDSVWILASMVEGHKLGETITPPGGFPQLGDYGLVHVNDAKGVQQIQTAMVRNVKPDDVASTCELMIQLARSSEACEGDDRSASEDIRTMSVKYAANGDRLRPFRESVGEMVECEMDDFPYMPRTCLEYLRAVNTIAESSVAQHNAWVHQSRIPESSRAVYKDEALSQILDVAISFDCLQVCNLASFELLVRRKQLIAEAHQYNPASPSYEGAEHYMGSRLKAGGAVIVPSLTDHVAKQLQAESQIMKERRKLAEAKGGGRGRGNQPSKAAPKGLRRHLGLGSEQCWGD